MKRNGHTILVIDDDPDIGIMIRLMLEYRGYRVLVAEQGHQAEEILHSEPVSLVIMDMLLSGENGTEICNAFKKDPSTSKLPVIMFSAHPNARQLCLDSGADDFISKPFDMGDLYSKVDKLIREN